MFPPLALKIQMLWCNFSGPGGWSSCTKASQAGRSTLLAGEEGGNLTSIQTYSVLLCTFSRRCHHEYLESVDTQIHPLRVEYTSAWLWNDL